MATMRRKGESRPLGKVPRILFFICGVATFTLFINNANAQWVLLDSNGYWDTFVDLASVRRVGAISKMLRLKNFRVKQTVNNKAYSSSVLEDEYDCEKKLVRLIKFTWFSENMGRGRMVFESPKPVEVDWYPIFKGNFEERLWTQACK